MPGRTCGAILLCLLSAGVSAASAPGIAERRQQNRSVSELIATLSAQDPEVRARAACELRDLGDRAAGAIEALAGLLADGSPTRAHCVRWTGRWNSDDETTPGEIAASALTAIGSRAYTALETALHNTSWIARRNAAWALGALDDQRAVPRLLDVLRDREAPVRQQAAWALGALDSRDATAALIGALKDTDAGVRQQAAWALGVLGR